MSDDETEIGFAPDPAEGNNEPPGSKPPKQKPNAKTDGEEKIGFAEQGKDGTSESFEKAAEDQPRPHRLYEKEAEKDEGVKVAYAQGQALLKTKKYPEVMEAMKKVLAKAQNNADFLYVFGIALAHIPGQQNNAIKVLDRLGFSNAKDQKRIDAYVVIMNIHRGQKNDGKAIEALKKAVLIGTTDDRTLKKLNRLREELDKENTMNVPWTLSEDDFDALLNSTDDGKFTPEQQATIENDQKRAAAAAKERERRLGGDNPMFKPT